MEQSWVYRERAMRMIEQMADYGYEADPENLTDLGRLHLRIGPCLYLAGEQEACLHHYDSMSRLEPDSTGEPISDLYWALALHRDLQHEEAELRLQRAMLNNLYLIPALIGEPIEPHPFRHLADTREPAYLDWPDVREYLEGPTDEDRRWCRAIYYGDRLTRLREAFVATFEWLDQVSDPAERGRILDLWIVFTQDFNPDRGDPPRQGYTGWPRFPDGSLDDWSASALETIHQRVEADRARPGSSGR